MMIISVRWILLAREDAPRARKLKSNTQYRKSGQSPLKAKKIIIVAGIIAVETTKAAMHCTKRVQDRARFRRPTSNSVSSAARAIDSKNRIDFIETPKQSPSKRPATSARRAVSGPVTSTVIHNNQSGAQRLSVRNSSEIK